MLFDAGVRYRIAGGFGVGALSWCSAKNDAAVKATIPDPFFFRTPRSFEGTARTLRHEEIVTHLHAVYALRPSKRVELALAAGPSFSTSARRWWTASRTRTHIRTTRLCSRPRDRRAYAAAR
jgi:hypothetical protein